VESITKVYVNDVGQVQSNQSLLQGSCASLLNGEGSSSVHETKKDNGGSSANRQPNPPLGSSRGSPVLGADKFYLVCDVLQDSLPHNPIEILLIKRFERLPNLIYV
jgi:hypothetical protein